MKSSILASAALMLAFILVGCNRSSTPTVEQAQTDKASVTDWKSVTLHFNNFKKTKSGAT